MATSESTTRCSSQERFDDLKSHRDVEEGTISTTSDHATTTLSSIYRHFHAEVNTQGGDFVLLLCWFTTGFLDSTIFQAYRTFVSMQTGNTIFIGLGASASTDPLPSSGQRPYSWLKSLSSLLAFLLGALLFARLSHITGGPTKRLTFTISFLIQTLFLLLSAILVQTGAVESRLEYIGEDIDWYHLLPIVLLSFQAPAQVAAGRAMGLWEVPTVVVTTMIYDFASDGQLFEGGVRGNAPRNRRFVGFCCLLVGAIAGGWITVYTRHIVVTLWVATGIKAAVTLGWVVWPSKGRGRG